MSSRDYEMNHKFLPSLQGKKSFVTLATNSLKLHIDADKANGTYVWIDPPWYFGDDRDVIESSETCPNYNDPEYESKVRLWGEKFTPIFESHISEIDAEPDGRLIITFSDGHRIFAPSTNADAQQTSWYDHWYYSEQTESQI